MTEVALHADTAFFTCTVEFRDASTDKAFEWVGLDYTGNSTQNALIAARDKAIRNAKADNDTKLVKRLKAAPALMIRINQQWDVTGRAL